MAIDPVTIAAIGAITSGVSAVGGGISTYMASQASAKQERLRKKQMNIDASNRRRTAIRQQILANSIANTRSVAQGVGEGSSVLFGAVGQAAGEAGRQISYTNMSEDIGEGIFSAAASQAGFQGAASMFNATGNFGNALFQNSQRLYDIGQTLLNGQTNPVATDSWVGGSGPSQYRPMIPGPGMNVNPINVPWYSNTGGD